MKTLVKTFLVSAAAIGISVAALSPASADDRWHHGGWGLGAAGLATGLIVGSAVASEPRYYEEPRYYDDEFAPPPPPSGYYGAPRRYEPVASNLRPWSPGWAQYCENRFRTFDGRTGTYVGNDGARHFCVVS